MHGPQRGEFLRVLRGLTSYDNYLCGSDINTLGQSTYGGLGFQMPNEIYTTSAREFPTTAVCTDILRMTFPTQNARHMLHTLLKCVNLLRTQEVIV